MQAMEVFTIVIMHYGMKECPKEMLSGPTVLTIDANKNCVATNGQEYENAFVKDIFGRQKMVKALKHCKTMIVCQGPK